MTNEHKTIHSVTKHEILCDQLFVSDAYPENCEVCKIIVKATQNGYKRGWKDSNDLWENMSKKIYYVPEMKKNEK
jgi:hypothetical protein